MEMMKEVTLSRLIGNTDYILLFVSLIMFLRFGAPVVLHHVWDDDMIWRWVSDWNDGVTDLQDLMQMSNETGLIK